MAHRTGRRVGAVLLAAALTVVTEAWAWGGAD
jgi:hypothetical protein